MIEVICGLIALVLLITLVAVVSYQPDIDWDDYPYDPKSYPYYDDGDDIEEKKGVMNNL